MLRALAVAFVLVAHRSSTGGVSVARPAGAAPSPTPPRGGARSTWPPTAASPSGLERGTTTTCSRRRSPTASRSGSGPVPGSETV